ncbi:hypothetical protein NQ317_002996 [Molorchus minor]|uniref:Uncharacterized protein n=1 Tax=Molorchus minor TaxID=1323400 RepID=A0ABQ9JNW2_9CUCU|nr:hypothetical protein NQ317_002996 [Molorchus minor]
MAQENICAWDEDGKGQNIWDNLTHAYPELIKDQNNGDVACDSYHKYKEDVAMLKELGVNHYRLSISWSRILPTGFPYKINEAGVQYYRNFIKELKENGIEPLVTIFHWDTPQGIHELFGNDVKYWLTFNEPKQTCQQGYGSGKNAPFVKSHGLGEYICTHILLKAHAKAWHIYDDEFRPTQNGRYSHI